MSSGYFKIAGGTVYDPAHGIEGQVRDLWIRERRIVEPPSDPDVRPDRTLDARGMVVMPGGIDMHCHIAGPKVNLARRMRPEERRGPGGVVASTAHTRSGTWGSVPSTWVTGYRYAGLGYTTAFEAATAPLGARHAHEELDDTPVIDKGLYVLMGNSHYLMQAIAAGETSRQRDFIAWLLRSAKGYAPKLVNPGGIELWKQHQAGNAHDLDTQVDGFGVTPRAILQSVTRAAAELELPHPVHIHANRLGLPGNWATTLETMRAVDGFRAHLTHIQFHSYGGGDEAGLSSQVATLVDYVNEHPLLTVDVGQVLFGPTTSMTGDGPLGYYLHQVYGSKWFSDDIELESGCGVVPIEYKQKSLVHAWQWAIGLEWYLLMRDPWRVAMSTDHPNGGSFLAYPEIIRLLMDRAYRREVLARVHPQVREQSLLGQLEREYTLSEICIITRAAPARMLGLAQKGNLGPGADADVTIYLPSRNWAEMFQLPTHVIKGGEWIVDRGEIRDPCLGRTLHVVREYDRALERDLAQWFAGRYSVQFANYPLRDDELAWSEAVG